MKTSHFTPRACPRCGYVMDSASSLDDASRGPAPGDFSICLKCASILRFTHDLQFKKATRADIIIAQPELLSQIDQAIETLQSMRKRN